ALRRLSGLGPPLPRLCLALEPLGLLDAAICLGSDPLLLALDFGDLVLHPLFGDRWVVAALGGNRWRHRARLWRGLRRDGAGRHRRRGSRARWDGRGERSLRRWWNLGLLLAEWLR